MPVQTHKLIQEKRDAGKRKWKELENFLQGWQIYI